MNGFKAVFPKGVLNLSPINPAKLQKQLQQKALEEKKNRDEAASNILKIHNLMEQSRKNGVDVKDFEKGLKDVQRQMRERDYAEAAKKSREVVELIHKTIKGMAEERSSALENLIEKGKNLGMDIGPMKASLGKIKEEMKNNNFFIAIKMAEESVENAKEQVKDFVVSMVDETGRLVEALEGSADTKKPIAILNDAKKKIEEGDMEAALELSKKARNLLNNVASSAAERLTTDAELDITILERMGEDAKEIQKRLAAAKKADPAKAIGEILEVGRVAAAAVKVALKSKIEGLKEEEEKISSLGGDAGEIHRMLEGIEDNIEKENLALAAETLERAKKKAEDTKFNIVVKAMNPAFTKLKAANKVGADISEPERLLMDARNALKIGEYEKAMHLSRECEKSLDDILESYKKTSEILPELEKLFSEAEKINADTSEAKKLLVLVKQAIGKRDFRKAYDLAVRTREALTQGKVNKIKELLASGKKLLKVGESAGIDLVDEEVALQEAEKALAAGDYEKARKIAEEGEEGIKKALSDAIESKYEEMEGNLERMKEERDVKEEMKLLKKGNKFLEFGDFESAVQTLDEIGKKIRDVEKEIADKLVAETKGAVEEILAEEGIKSGELEELVADMLAAQKEGKYGLAIKLSKEADKKANQLGKNLAKREYTRVKEKLLSLKNMQNKPNLKQFNDRILEAKADFKRGKYLQSAKISREVLEDIERTVNLYESAVSALSAAQSAVKEAKKRGKKVGAPSKKILECRNLIAAGKYEDAVKVAESVNDTLESIGAASDLESRVKVIEAKMFSAKTLGISIEGVDEKLENIKSLIKKGEAEKAEKIANEMEAEIEKSVKDSIEEKISVADSLIRDAEYIGINVEKAEENILVAKDAMKKGDYIDAYRYAEEAQDIIDEIKAVSKKVAGKIKSAQMKIGEAESIRADVRNAKIILDRAIDALKNNRTKEAVKLAEECIEAVEKAEESKVRAVIGDFVNMVEKSKKTGMNTALAENLIHQAENALEEKKYQKALSLAMQSENELERVELQEDIAEKAIKTLKRKIDEIKEKGLPVEDVIAILYRSEGAYDAGAYIKAFEYTMKASERLQELTEEYERIESELEELDKKMKEAREDHIEVTGASELYSKAKSAIAAGKAKEASQLVAAALKSLNSSLLEHAGDILDYAEAKVKYARKLGANVSEAEVALKEAQKIKEKEPEKAISLANGARVMIGSLDLDTSFVDRVYGTNFEISRAKKFGISMKSAENTLKNAVEALDTDVKKAEELLSQANEDVKRILGKLTPKIELELKAGPIEKEQWNTVVFAVKNTGDSPAKDIHIEVSGDIEIEGMRDIDELDKGSTVELPVKIMVQKDGETEVDAHIRAKRVFDEKEFEFSSKQVLKTPAKIEGAKEVTAEKREKCAFCNGAIKPGMKMVVCGKCGATYHLPCAKRSGKCKVCGASLEIANKPKTARKKLAIKLG